MSYRHLFFDMDKTVAPSRQPIEPHMFDFLTALPHDITIVSGQLSDKIAWQSNNLKAAYLGQNGNYAQCEAGNELWHTPLSEEERAEVLAHIEELKALLDSEPDEVYNPVEDRGAQITFSPVGNTAPVELKKVYDPDASKRMGMLKRVPLESDTMMAVIGGSTSIDYIPKTRHKGTNVAKYIEHKGWDKAACVYFGDGLYPGGNDEFVIGVIDTILVTDHEDCYQKLQKMFGDEAIDAR
jgi:phosphomannomutase